MGDAKNFPVIVVTGSSGSGTSTVTEAIGSAFYRGGIRPLLIEGDSFHGYDWEQMTRAVKEAQETFPVPMKTCLSFA